MSAHEQIYPQATKEFAEQRKNLASKTAEAFKAFSQSVFADGALSAKTKQLVAVAVAHVTQCPYCIRGHTKLALQHGATPQEIMEAYGSQLRCGLEAPMPTPFLHSTRSTTFRAKRTGNSGKQCVDRLRNHGPASQPRPTVC